MITLTEFINTCETGDLLLYSGKAWYSWMIEYISDSPYSHISMILKDPIFMNKILPGIYIIEAKHQRTLDSIREKPIFGTRIIPFIVAYKDYVSDGGNIYYRKLCCIRDDVFMERLSSTITTLFESSYDINPYDWLRTEFGILYGNYHRDDTFWCSVLITYIYVRLGFLPGCIEWSLMKPSRFGGLAKDTLKFIESSVELDKLITIDNYDIY